jgi:hypothetical protein
LDGLALFGWSAGDDLKLAELLRYYYNEKRRIFHPSGDEAAEYVLTDFA